MSEQASRSPDPPFMSSIPDPDMRRAIRAVYQDLHATIEKQHVEIQALLEVILEKHVTSIGEYKRHLARLQQGGVARSERIQSQIEGAVAPPGMTPRERMGGH